MNFLGNSFHMAPLPRLRNFERHFLRRASDLLDNTFLRQLRNQLAFNSLLKNLSSENTSKRLKFFIGLLCAVNLCKSFLKLRKLFKTPIFERWGKQFCLN